MDSLVKKVIGIINKTQKIIEVLPFLKKFVYLIPVEILSFKLAKGYGIILTFSMHRHFKRPKNTNSSCLKSKFILFSKPDFL